MERKKLAKCKYKEESVIESNTFFLKLNYVDDRVIEENKSKGMTKEDLKKKKKKKQSSFGKQNREKREHMKENRKYDT